MPLPPETPPDDSPGPAVPAPAAPPLPGMAGATPSDPGTSGSPPRPPARISDRAALEAALGGAAGLLLGRLLLGRGAGLLAGGAVIAARLLHDSRHPSAPTSDPPLPGSRGFPPPGASSPQAPAAAPEKESSFSLHGQAPHPPEPEPAAASGTSSPSAPSQPEPVRQEPASSAPPPVSWFESGPFIPSDPPQRAPASHPVPAPSHASLPFSPAVPAPVPAAAPVSAAAPLPVFPGLESLVHHPPAPAPPHPATAPASSPSFQELSAVSGPLPGLPAFPPIHGGPPEPEDIWKQAAREAEAGLSPAAAGADTDTDREKETDGVSVSKPLPHPQPDSASERPKASPVSDAASDLPPETGFPPPLHSPGSSASPISPSDPSPAAASGLEAALQSETTATPVAAPAPPTGAGAAAPAPLSGVEPAPSPELSRTGKPAPGPPASSFPASPGSLPGPEKPGPVSSPASGPLPGRPENGGTTLPVITLKATAIPLSQPGGGASPGPAVPAAEITPILKLTARSPRPGSGVSVPPPGPVSATGTAPAVQPLPSGSPDHSPAPASPSAESGAATVSLSGDSGTETASSRGPSVKFWLILLLIAALVALIYHNEVRKLKLPQNPPGAPPPAATSSAGPALSHPSSGTATPSSTGVPPSAPESSVPPSPAPVTPTPAGDPAASRSSSPASPTVPASASLPDPGETAPAVLSSSSPSSENLLSQESSSGISRALRPGSPEAAAKTALERLLTARSPDELSSLIHRPEETLKRAARLFPDGNLHPSPWRRITLESVDRLPGSPHQSWLFRVVTDAIPAGFPVSVDGTPSGPRIDFEAFVQCRDTLLDRFAAPGAPASSPAAGPNPPPDTSALPVSGAQVTTRPALPAGSASGDTPASRKTPPASGNFSHTGTFMTVLRRAHYFGHDLPAAELDQLLCFEIASPNPGASRHPVFAPKNTPLGTQLMKTFQWDRTYTPVVTLTRRGPHLFLTSVVRGTWRQPVP